MREIYLNTLEVKDELVELIKNTKGKMFTVTFIKRSTGDERVMTARIGVTKHLKGGQASFNAKEKNLFIVYDMNNKGYRSINLDTVFKLKFKGVTFNVNKGSYLSFLK